MTVSISTTVCGEDVDAGAVHCTDAPVPEKVPMFGNADHSMVSPLSGVSASLIVAVSVTRSPIVARLFGWLSRGGVTVSAPTSGSLLGEFDGATNVNADGNVALFAPTVTLTLPAPAT